MTLPAALEPFSGKSDNLCFDAPWNIVFQIQHRGSFWKDVEFPADAPYNLSATSSSPHNDGALYGNPMDECTPDEVLHKVLFQLGITDDNERSKLVQKGVVDPVHLDFTDGWQRAEDTETVELDPLHADGKRWVNNAQIYVRSAPDPKIDPVCASSGVFLAADGQTSQIS